MLLLMNPQSPTGHPNLFMHVHPCPIKTLLGILKYPCGKGQLYPNWSRSEHYIN